MECRLWVLLSTRRSGVLNWKEVFPQDEKKRKEKQILDSKWRRRTQLKESSSTSILSSPSNLNTLSPKYPLRREGDKKTRETKTKCLWLWPVDCDNGDHHQRVFSPLAPQLNTLLINWKHRNWIELMARKMAPRSRLGTAYSLVFVSHVVSVASYGHGSREIKPGLLLVLAGCRLKYS